jgi:hypothetical protein
MGGARPPFSSFDDHSRETEAISMARNSDSAAEAAKDRWATGFGGSIVSDAERAAPGALPALLGAQG